MDSKTFKEKYKSKEMALAVVLDALIQESLKEKKEASILPFLKYSGRKLLVCENGITIFNTFDRCLIDVIYSENEMHVNKLYWELSALTKITNIIFVCLDDLKPRTNKNTKYKVFDYSSVESLINSYHPVFLNYFVKKQTRTKIDNITATNNKTNIFIGKPIDNKLSYSQIKSNKHQSEYSKLLQNDSNQCAFILGNGVSIPFGSDPWETLVKNLVDYLSPFYISHKDNVVNILSKSNYLTSSFVQNLLDSKSHPDIYYAGLRYCVYRKYHPEMLETNSLIKSIALTKIKYPKLELYTYNYDTFVEYQIKKENPSFVIKSISNRHYKKYLDNGVIHLHGIIKENNVKKNRNIVLTDIDYFNHYFSTKSWVYKAQLNALTNNHCLFIGSSMSDLFQLSIIENAYKKIGDDWYCYALLCFKDLSENEEKELIDFYLKKHIKVIFVKEYKKLEETLNDISNISFSNNPVSKD